MEEALVFKDNIRCHTQTGTVVCAVFCSSSGSGSIVGLHVQYSNMDMTESRLLEVMHAVEEKISVLGMVVCICHPNSTTLHYPVLSVLLLTVQSWK